MKQERKEVIHPVLGTTITDQPEGYESIIIGMGCFWGAERLFWESGKVHTTAVGYGGGVKVDPTYEEVCYGDTGHNELVKAVFNPQEVGYKDMLKIFWEGHDPTQYMRQGNDVGSQYRSGIYVINEKQRIEAEKTKDIYQEILYKHGMGEITTEIVEAGEFYYAEEYHQQYLYKNPGGYCGLGGTGLACHISQ